MEIERLAPMEHVQMLAGTIGCRMTASAGGRSAANYIAGMMERAGLQVERQEFEFTDWVELTTRVTVAGRPVKAYANTFSPACDVIGPLLAIGSRAAFETEDLAGKIVVLYGEMAQAPFWTREFFLTSEQDRAMYDRLESQRAAAVITVNPALGQRWRLFEDRTFRIPSATVPLGIGLELVRRAGESARLRITARCAPGMTENVIGRLSATIPGEGRILICAHYDTKHDTPGAGDNAGGVAVMLALAEHFARQKHRPAMEFVAFTNEEYYTGPESDVYFQSARDSFPAISAVINVDGVGRAISTSTVASFAASAAFDALLDNLRAGDARLVKVDPWPASNHFLFFSNGVPCLAFSSLGPANLDHTPNDTVEWISPERLEHLVRFITGLIEAFPTFEPAWTRP